MGRVLLDTALRADGFLAGETKGGNFLGGVGWAGGNPNAGLVGEGNLGGDELVCGGASGPFVIPLASLAEELGALEAEGGARVLVANVAANGAQVLSLCAVILHSAETEGEVVGGERVNPSLRYLKAVLTPRTPKRKVAYHKSQRANRARNHEDNDVSQGGWMRVFWGGRSTSKGGMALGGCSGWRCLPLRTKESRQVLQHE